MYSFNIFCCKTKFFPVLLLFKHFSNNVLRASLAQTLYTSCNNYLHDSKMDDHWRILFKQLFIDFRSTKTYFSALYVCISVCLYTYT